MIQFPGSRLAHVCRGDLLCTRPSEGRNPTPTGTLYFAERGSFHVTTTAAFESYTVSESCAKLVQRVPKDFIQVGPAGL